ncbi:UDP-N-acetylmuramoyl-tripeptide--D-alanyl-D-alanine ligase [Tannerella forsythia]|uniref:UDP-N-acetylmuramoyl-tripeptide--D-alanyl-D-alanine ligase n=1 Tax=Tannerella forsythia TaxID=28112 RepID=A0A3P1YH48_TANFO|nr:UDP-N-acetylmuramoyl-tripeptide--D-alanyl-D-alanine ligase [Tannerella forsythia]RRD70444.1 UDP-N-acetylmuramoyl-tripeptide--D-alanyl-D-alanine ligase [Tannerella forsythia]
MNLDDLYALFRKYPRVTTDSRNCPPGSLFFALKGDTFDGNRFAAQALESGCAYAIVDDPAEQKNDRTILTDSVLDTLQRLAAHHRRELGTPIIGITGTNGKTTTKELLAAVLSEKYKTLHTLGNYNNHIGVPLTLLRLTDEYDVAVIEMGANHPGEIRALTQLVRPDYGLITNVGQAHLEGFGSFENVVRTKAELYDFMRTGSKKIFIHQENEWLQGIAHGLEKIAYGREMQDDTFVAGRVTENRPFLSFQWWQKDGNLHTVNTQLVGDYNLWNALAAIAAGRTFEVSAEKINRAIAGYTPTNNRSQWKKTAHNTLIIDAYNANPSSMRVALENFAAWDVTPKAVILGDMRELGKESQALHADVIEQLKTCHFDKVILCGEQLMAAGGKQYDGFPSVEALEAYLAADPLRGYHILIKGSHGMRLEKIVGRL